MGDFLRGELAFLFFDILLFTVSVEFVKSYGILDSSLIGLTLASGYERFLLVKSFADFNSISSFCSCYMTIIPEKLGC